MPTITVNTEISDKWKEKIKEIANSQIAVKVGFIEGATYPDGTSVATVAYINEYGRGHNPERPFMRDTANKKMGEWVDGIKSMIKGKVIPRNIENAYNAIGLVMVGDIKEAILNYEGQNPTNNPKTIAVKARRARGGGKNQVAINPNQVLVDSALMAKAVSHEVIR